MSGTLSKSLVKADVNSLKPDREPAETERERERARAEERSRKQIGTGGRGFDRDI